MGVGVHKHRCSNLRNYPLLHSSLQAELGVIVIGLGQLFCGLLLNVIFHVICLSNILHATSAQCCKKRKKMLQTASFNVHAVHEIPVNTECLVPVCQLLDVVLVELDARFI